MRQVGSQLHVPMIVNMITEICHDERIVVYVAANGVVHRIERNARVRPGNVGYAITQPHGPLQFFTAHQWNLNIRVDAYTTPKNKIITIIGISDAQPYLRKIPSLMPFFSAIGLPDKVNIQRF